MELYGLDIELDRVPYPSAAQQVGAGGDVATVLVARLDNGRVSKQ